MAVQLRVPVKTELTGTVLYRALIAFFVYSLVERYILGPFRNQSQNSHIYRALDLEHIGHERKFKVLFSLELNQFQDIFAI